MTDLQVQMDAAKAYEAVMVPALFGQWASHVADAAGIKHGQRVLDVACGTGVLSREAASRTGRADLVAGIDPAAGMLEVARQAAPTLEWRQGVAESLPFPDQSFDSVVSQFGLMFFNDRKQALREMLRVLSPGGTLAVAVWDSLENSAAYDIEVDLLDRVAGQRAADTLRAPFVLGDTEELKTLFEGAGVSSVNITTRHGTARFPSVQAMVEADLRGWLPVMGVVLEEERIQSILAEADGALREYVTAEGQVVFDAPAAEVIERINAELPLEPVGAQYRGEVARRYRYRDGGGEIGVISSVTAPFCSDCSRARLSSDGKLFTCLFAGTGRDLKTPLRSGMSDEEIASMLRSIWMARSDRYSEIRSEETTSLPRVGMSQIGG
ncbi:MAG: methyltransferase domain-containing protein [Acidobacteria bacterium]|nr:methyltransferase domain-containing protein [Acidobacteriota bacterium]